MANEATPSQAGSDQGPAQNPARTQIGPQSMTAMSMIDISNTALSLLEREQLIAEREADLQARRREAAREIRRQRREAANLDARLGEISTLMAELARGVLQNNAIVSEHAEAMASSVSNQLEASLAQLLESRPAEAVEHRPNYDPELLESNLRLQNEVDRLHKEIGSNQQLKDEVNLLHEEVESLTMQNEELAASLARSTVKQSISSSSDSDPTMSWEKRKELMFAQDSKDSGHSDSLVYHDALTLQTLSNLKAELEAKDAELNELRHLLEQRPDQAESGTTFGAAAIAQLMDSDELVIEERRRLQDLQAEWESKFREVEIAASIERATLAREHQKLQRRNHELEEQMEHLKQELRQEAIAGPNQSRRWLAKLGLAE